MGAFKGDTGNAVNVANYELFNTTTASLGVKYNPANGALAVAEMKKDEPVAKDAVEAVAKPKDNYDKAVAERNNVEDTLNDTVRGVFSDLMTNPKITVETKNKLTTLGDLISGNNVKQHSREKAKQAPPTTPGTPNPTPDTSSHAHSVSQQSHTKRSANFTDFVSLVENTPDYVTNEPLAKPAALRKKADLLKSLNKQVDDLYIPYSDAMKQRDLALYHPVTGICSKARLAKYYVSKSPAFSAREKKMIAAIKFTVPSDEDLHF